MMSTTTTAVQHAAKKTVSATAPEAVFHARGLSKVYRMGEVEVHALRDINLDLYEGELVVILGPSGGGKSTLLNILGGLDVPTSGEVNFRDHVLTGANDRALTRFRREHVGFVFQFYNLIPSLTALENVELVTEIAARPMSGAEALRKVGLEARLHHFPAQLSGGEQQRVAIARAIVNRPKIILADEPTAYLDRDNAIIVINALKAFQRSGVTCIISSHDEQFLDQANRVIYLSKGEVTDSWTSAVEPTVAA